MKFVVYFTDISSVEVEALSVQSAYEDARLSNPDKHVEFVSYMPCTTCDV